MRRTTGPRRAPTDSLLTAAAAVGSGEREARIVRLVEGPHAHVGDALVVKALDDRLNADSLWPGVGDEDVDALAGLQLAVVRRDAPRDVDVRAGVGPGAIPVRVAADAHGVQACVGGMIRVAPRDEPDPLQRAGLGDASLEDMHAVLRYGHPVE